MNVLANIKQKALDADLLIRNSDEKKYASEHGLSIKRLENGAKILAVQRKVSDSRQSTVSFHINSGGHFDPRGYEGAHHFLEHLFFTQKLRNLYQKHLIEANAYTSQEKIVFFNRGGYNSTVKEFGLDNVLRDSMDSLIYPSTLDNKEGFQFSKEVILREIDEFYADYRRYMFDELYKLTLTEDNPFYNSALGYRGSVGRTTPQIVEKVLNQQISTKNMIATVYAEGIGKESEDLSKTVNRLLENFPRTHDVKAIDWEDAAKTKPLHFGKTVRHSVPLPSNIVSINYVWMIPIEFLSQDDIVMRLLGPFLSELFSIEGREKGLGYSLYFYPRYFFPEKMMITASVLCPVEELGKTRERMEEVVKTTLKRPLEDIKLFDELLGTEKSRQMVEPISSGRRLDASFETIQWFDLLFNSEKMRELFLSVQIKDLQSLQQKLVDQEPAVFILGNL